MSTDTYVMPNKQLAAALLAPLRNALTVVLIFGVLLLAFWFVCLSLYFGSWGRDEAHLLALFRDALGDFAPGEPLAHVAGVAKFITDLLHRVLFVATGMDGVHPANSGGQLDKVVGSLMSQLGPSLRVVIVSTQVFGLRMASLAGMLPLVLLGYVVAHVDGNCERAIRRACAGRESANLYHRAKYMQYGLLGALLMATLCLPMHLDPVITMLLFVCAVTVLARVQWTYYKKYA